MRHKTIVVDPPWRYGTWGKPSVNRGRGYGKSNSRRYSKNTGKVNVDGGSNGGREMSWRDCRHTGWRASVERNWFRDIEIRMMYFFGGATTVELAIVFELSRQRVWKICGAVKK